MPGENSSKILFVINPVSGGTVKTEWETSIKNYFREKKDDIELYNLTGSNDVEKIDVIIKNFRPGKVVAVGGDGTVSMVAKMLLGTGIALAILPAGSANGMAKELGIPDIREEAIKIVEQGTIRDADVIRVNNEHICLHLSDIGLNAQLIKHFEEGKLRGKFGYATKVVKTLWTGKRMKVNIIAGGKESSHSALMVVLANATKYGTGAVINPEGSLYDGLFEVVIIRKLALSEILKMLFRPSPFNPQKIKLFPATSVNIITSRRMHFQVDGEYMGRVNKIEAHIVAGQLKLVVP